MRVLIIDPEGSCGIDLALRSRQQGHTVKVAIKENERRKLIGKGLVDVVRDPREWFRWADLIVHTDSSIYLRDLDIHRREGGRVIASSQETAAWETDRQLGQAIMRKAGLQTLPSKEFTDYDEAIAYVKKTGKRYVSKPTGGIERDKALSYVSSGPDDMVFMLQRWKKLNKLKTPFVLQDHIQGVEMGVAGWFGPGGWNEGFEENFEHKALMNDNKGPSTGEQGTILRYVRRSKLGNKILLPLTRTLERANYVGDIDVNCIIDERGNVWPLEFTTRLGWPAFHLQTALIQGDVAEFLLDLANGRDARPFAYDQIVCGVVLTIPDYPYSKWTGREISGIPIYGLKGALWKHVHLCETAFMEAPLTIDGQVLMVPQPVTAGDYVLVMTAVSSSVKDAALTCYRRLAKLSLPASPMYRTDIGKRLAKELPILQKHNYATGMVYSQES